MRWCEIDKLDLDIPCERRATNTLKITSKKIGDHREWNYSICDYHYNLLNEQEVITDLLGPHTQGGAQVSDKYSAALIKGKTSSSSS